MTKLKLLDIKPFLHHKSVWNELRRENIEETYYYFTVIPDDEEVKCENEIPECYAVHLKWFDIKEYNYTRRYYDKVSDAIKDISQAIAIMGIQNE